MEKKKMDQQHREQVNQFLHKAQEIAAESGLQLSGGGMPQEDGSYVFNMTIRFPEHEPEPEPAQAEAQG